MTAPSTSCDGLSAPPFAGARDDDARAEGRREEGRRAVDLLEAGSGWARRSMGDAFQSVGSPTPPPSPARWGCLGRPRELEQSAPRALATVPASRVLPRAHLGTRPARPYRAPPLAELGEQIGAERASTMPAALPPDLHIDVGGACAADARAAGQDAQLRLLALILRREARLHAYVFGPLAQRAALADALTATGALAAFCAISEAALADGHASAALRAARGMLLSMLVGPCDADEVIRGRMCRLLPCTQADHDHHRDATAPAVTASRSSAREQVAAVIRHLWHVSRSRALYEPVPTRRVPLTVVRSISERLGVGRAADLLAAATHHVRVAVAWAMTPAPQLRAICAFHELVDAYAVAGGDSLAAVQRGRRTLAAVRRDLAGPYHRAAELFDQLLRQRSRALIDAALDELEAQWARTPEAAEAIFVAITDLMATGLLPHPRSEALYRRALARIGRNARRRAIGQPTP